MTMPSLNRFLAVANKEFLELKRNPLFFVMSVLAPLILFFLFAYGFPLDIKNIPLGVLDLDKSAESRTLLDMFENGKVFQIDRITQDQAVLERELSLGKLRAILVIPAHFSKTLLKGLPVTLQILVDGTYPNRAILVSGYAEATLFAFRTRVLEKFFLKTFGNIQGAGPPIELSTSVWYNPSFRSEDFMIPGVIAIILMFFPPLVAAISLAREKETGSILHMYGSPVSKEEYLLGKMLPYLITTFMNFLIFLFFTVFLFHVPLRGSLTIFLAISFFYAAAAILTGLSVAVFVNTQIAAILITAVATLTPSFLYSGFMVPVSNIGENARLISYCLPSTYFIDAARKLMIKGAGWQQVQGDFFALALFCLVFYGFCMVPFKKRLG